MQHAVGNYDAAKVSQLAHLSVRLNGDKLNVGWMMCDLTAQFTSQYFANLYLGAGQGNDFRRKVIEHTHSVSYVMNEMMENAVKFRAGGDIYLKAGMLGDQFCCAVSNLAGLQSAQKLAMILQEISDGDPQALLLQRFEDNAANPDSNASGLGFLTMINDYGADVSCRFEALAVNIDRVRIETLITLPIARDDSNGN